MRMRRRLYVRQFLNRPGHHRGAYVLLEVEDTSRVDDPDCEPSVLFEITDCYRRVDLDFDLDTASARRNSVRKARLLADAMARFADAVAAEAELAEARAERRRRPRS